MGLIILPIIGAVTTFLTLNQAAHNFPRHHTQQAEQAVSNRIDIGRGVFSFTTMILLIHTKLL